MSNEQGRYRGKQEYALVYSELITAAKYRGTVTYQGVAQIMGLPLGGNHMGKEVGWLVGEISEDELANGRPMLSARVVAQNGKPSGGFFEWARTLGRLTSQDQWAFWESERKAVYNTWKVKLQKG